VKRDSSESWLKKLCCKSQQCSRSVWHIENDHIYLEAAFNCRVSKCELGFGGFKLCCISRQFSKRSMNIETSMSGLWWTVFTVQKILSPGGRGNLLVEYRQHYRKFAKLRRPPRVTLRTSGVLSRNSTPRWRSRDAYLLSKLLLDSQLFLRAHSPISSPRACPSI
jgi:hypothetical protein